MINIGTSTINAVKLGTTNISAVYIGTTKLYPAQTLDWFYLEDASGAANTVSITKNDANAPTLTIETSTNGATWTTAGTTSTTALNISVPANGKVYVRCNANAWSDGTNYNAVSSTGDFNVGGNIMSLLYGSNFTGSETSFPSGSTHIFYRIFFYASHLVDASTLELPATTLVDSCYASVFQGCTSLTAAPELPATTLANNCYNGMFYNCAALTAAPELPATTLANTCYRNMFNGCSSLATAPELPATTLAANCYNGMFAGCTSLTAAPALPAMTLAGNCYQSMFSGCTSLTTAPALPATTMLNSAYYQMFQNCTALTTAPTLPAMTLAASCYGRMFAGCTSLTTAPELSATTLANASYYQMFNGCASLNSITCLATDITATNCTAGWVNGVAATGTFYKTSSMSSWTTGTSGIPTGWTSANYDEWFYVKDASGSANTVSIKKNNANAPTLTIETSTNGYTWTTAGTTSTTALNISVPANGKVYVRCSANSWGGTNYNAFSSTGNFKVGGNIMSLIYGSNFTGRETSFPSGSTYNFQSLFYNATRLVDASNLVLPATTLTADCYHYMFRGCTALTSAPALPATTLASGCYGSMFYECASLTAAPVLPATTLAHACYNYMFYNCTSLIAAPALPATNIQTWCYRAMFYKCTALVSAPALPATTLTENCYQTMFSGCTSLTTAPALPATTLAQGCYQQMFNGCTSLNSITCLATDISATNCTSDWVTNVAATGTFRKDYTMYDFEIDSNNGIPTGWTIQDANAPDYTEPFYLENPTNNPTTVQLVKSNGNAPTLSIQTSLDGTTWTTWGSTSTTALNITVPANGKRYIRCNTAVWANASARNYFSTSIEKFNVGGNIMSLLYGSSFTGAETAFPWVSSGSGDEPFRGLFMDNTKLYKASALLLPPTTLIEACYASMFSGCTSLTAAPALPATTLAKYCYKNMFKGCTSLTSIKVAFTSWPNISSGATTQATYDWTYGLPASGTFYKKSGLSVQMNASGNTTTGQTTIAGYCNAIPYNWTVTNY